MRGVNLLDEHEDVALFGESGVKELYYDKEINRFIDSFGSVIHDIFRLITPNQYRVFIEYKNQYVIPDRTNKFLVELIYPDEEE